MENRKLEIPGLCGEKRIILRPFLSSQPSVQLLAIPDQILGPISAAKPRDLPPITCFAFYRPTNYTLILSH
jgi:hypothetical protein